MTVPSGYAEELALEEAAAVEHDRRAAALWAAGGLAARTAALAEREAAAACRAHVAHLRSISEHADGPAASTM